MNLRDIDHLATTEWLKVLSTKSFNAPMVHSGFGGYGSGDGSSGRFGGMLKFNLPGAQFDWGTQAGELWMNSAVAICLRWLKTNFSEPRLIVEDKVGGNWKPIEHDVLTLLDNPNPAYDGDIMWGSAVLSGKVDGNAYLLKSKSLAGHTKELWYAPHWEVQPRWTSGSRFIEFYEHTVDGKKIRLENDEVIHLREGLDPLNLRYGMSDLKSTYREICSDNEASGYTASILKNLGIPGLVITPSDPNATWDEPERMQIKSDFKTRFTGDRRGDPLVGNTGLTIQEVGYSPEKMALDKIRNVPEARICSAIGLDAMLVGLSIGLASRKFANYQEARKAGYHDCLMPLQKTWAKQLQKQLVADFPDLADRRKRRIRWDYSDVEALMDDQDAKSKRVIAEYKGELLKLDEARSGLGQQPVGGDIGEAFYKPSFQSTSLALQPIEVNTDKLAPPVIRDDVTPTGDVQTKSEREDDADPFRRWEY